MEALRLKKSDFTKLAEIKSKLLEIYSKKELEEKNERQNFASCNCSGSCRGSCVHGCGGCGGGGCKGGIMF